MIDRLIKVLLIEDNPDDVLLIREALAVISGAPVDLESVDRLQDGLERLAEERFDVVLLDMGLPDSQGLETVEKICAEAPGVPIVVLTGLDDEALGVKAVRAGAQDFLTKGQMDSRIMIRAIGYAIERHRLLTEIERQQHELEVRSLERMSQQPSSEAAFRRGIREFRTALPEAFDELVVHYGRVLDTVFEEKPNKEALNVSEELSNIGNQLGALDVEPGDVVAIHSEAFKRRLRDNQSQKGQSYMRESRLLVIELMGKLVSYYRNKYLSLSGVAETTRG